MRDKSKKSSIYYFNPRSHERSDKLHYILGRIYAHFNPRSHERSDVSLLHFQSRPRDFNPRSHERSDLMLSMKHQSIPLFQSTLPREERRNGSLTTYRLLLISIHAPTRGATTIPVPTKLDVVHISIHAPTRGATVTSYYICKWLDDFNPRSHERSDFARIFFGFYDYISIHAPTRGATT